MTNLFLKILNMSLSATWLVLAVLLLRLLLRKAPKWINVLLWGLVAVRLLCPFTIQSSLSRIPEPLSSGQMLQEWSDDYIGSVEIIHDSLPEYDQAVEAGRPPISAGEGSHYVVTAPDKISAPSTIGNTVLPRLAVLWILGMALMVLYTLMSWRRLRRQVRQAIRVKGNIYISEFIASPFVLGIWKPRIYLPYHMSEPDRTHVIAHERSHIRRRDHWWKPLGFGLLSIHWFNPLMWLAYVLLCRDIEMACDERVVQQLSPTQRANYSQALLHCSVTQRSIAACPLAFGEVSVRHRVKNVLTYRRPAFWLILVSLLLTFTASVFFLTNPKEQASPFGQRYQMSEVTCAPANISFQYTPENTPLYELNEDQSLTILENPIVQAQPESDAVNVSQENIPLEPFTLTKKNFDDYFHNTPTRWQGTTMEELRKDNAKAWRSYPLSDSSDSCFYYLLQQKNGELYLALGIDDAPATDGSLTYYLRYIFRLTSQADNQALQALKGAVFHVQQAEYADPQLSSTWSQIGVPYFGVSGGGDLLRRRDHPTVQPSEDQAWVSLGELKALTLTEGNFDNCFPSSFAQGERIRRSNAQAWQVTEYSYDIRCLLLKQKDGSYYLAYGTYDRKSNTTAYHYLLKLGLAQDFGWSVAVTPISVTPTSATLMFRQVGLLMEGSLSTGADYTLERMGAAGWESVPCLLDNLIFPTIAYVIEPDGSHLTTIDWTEAYGTLTVGRYRIGKSVSLSLRPGDTESTTFYTEFTISAPTTEYLTIQEVTPTGMTLKHTFSEDPGEVIALDSFWMETYQNGQWSYLLPTVEPDAVSPDIKRTIRTYYPDEDTTELDWSGIYGELPPGIYRVAQQQYHQTLQTMDLVTATAEFTIPEDSGIHILLSNLSETGLTVEVLPESSVSPGEYFFQSVLLEKKDRYSGYGEIYSSDGELLVSRKSLIPHSEIVSKSAEGSSQDITSLPPMELRWDEAFHTMLDGSYRICLTLLHVLPSGEEEEITLYKYFDPADYAWGHTLSVGTVTPTGLTLDIASPDLPLRQGESFTLGHYRLEYRFNNQWNPMSTLSSTRFPGAFRLKSGSTASGSLNWSDAYGRLTQGTYRLTADILHLRSDGTQETRQAYAVFTVPDTLFSLDHIPAGYSLEQAALDGIVTFIDGDLGNNAWIWQAFLKDTSKGQAASVRTMHWYNLPDPDRVAPELYAEMQETYPIQYLFELTYDGTTYTIRWYEDGREQVKTYQYLRHFTGTPSSLTASYDRYEYYILTNHATATYEELFQSALSSQYGAYIDHMTVYSDLTTLPDALDIPDAVKAELVCDGDILVTLTEAGKLDALCKFLRDAEALDYEPKTYSTGLDLILTGEDGSQTTLQLVLENDLCILDGAFFDYGPGYGSDGSLDKRDQLLKLLGITTATPENLDQLLSAYRADPSRRLDRIKEVLRQNDLTNF